MKMKKVIITVSGLIFSSMAMARSPYFPAQGILKAQSGCESIGIQAGQTVRFAANKNTIQLGPNNGTVVMDVNSDDPSDLYGELLVLHAQTQNFGGIVDPQGSITIDGRSVGIGFLEARQTSSTKIEIDGSAYDPLGHSFDCN